MANKVKENVCINDLFIDTIDDLSSNDWDELCNTCSSLIDKAKMTNKDIDDIVVKVKNDIL